MEIKILQVFLGADGLPYKDQGRTIHFPIVGSGFQGASNTTKIRFYYDELVEEDDTETAWVACAKLPNGKIGSKVLETDYDSALGEHYASLELDSFYFQYKGDVYISLQGYQGGVQVSYDEETELYTIYGTPTIAATGSIKLSVNYATQFVGSGETSNINFQRILADLGTKLGIRAQSEHVEELPSVGQNDIFYVVNDDPNDPNLQNIYVWNENTQSYVWVGDNTLDLGNYYTNEQGEQFENDVNEEIELFEQNTNERVSNVETQVQSIASGSPKGVYATVSDLTTANPNHDYIYLVLADNKWYYYNTGTSSWSAGGTYLASSSDDMLKSDSINSIQNKVVYNSLKDLIEQNVSGSVNAGSNNWIDFNFVEGRTYIIKNTSSITTGMVMHTTLAKNYTWEEDINSGSVINTGATITFTATKPAKYLYIYCNNGGTFNIYATKTLEHLRDELNEIIENNNNNSKKLLKASLYNGFYQDTLWEQGGISGSNGQNTSSNYDIRTKNIIYGNGDYIFEPAENIKMFGFLYDASGTFLNTIFWAATSKQKYTLTNGNGIRLVFSSTIASTVLDPNIFYEYVMFGEETYLTKKLDEIKSIYAVNSSIGNSYGAEPLLVKWEQGEYSGVNGAKINNSSTNRIRIADKIARTEIDNIWVASKKTKIFVLVYNNDETYRVGIRWGFAGSLDFDSLIGVSKVNDDDYITIFIGLTDDSDIKAEDYYKYVVLSKKTSLSKNLKPVLNVLPEYYDDYMPARIEDLRKYASFTRGITFPFITDVHLFLNEKHSNKMIKMIDENTNCVPFVIFGGDVPNAISTEEDVIADANFWNNYISYWGKDKTIQIRGNHDYMCATNEQLTESWFATLGQVFQYVQANNYYRFKHPIGSLYGVLTIEEQKIKIIAYDNDYGYNEETNYFPDTYRASQEELDFIANEILNSNGYDIIVVTHETSSQVLAGSDTIDNMKPINNLLLAAKNKRAVSYSGQGVVLNYDFSGFTGDIVCELSGHKHKDQWSVEDGLLYIITTCDCCSNEDPTYYPRLRNTLSEQAFDVMCVDTLNKQISMVRFGGGYDRVFANYGSLVNYVTNAQLNESSLTLSVNETSQLSCSVEYNSTYLTDNNYRLEWSSSSTTVATVNESGLVTAKATGSATITCVVKSAEGTAATLTCSITVS